ncbi:SNF2 family N-terminal domain-containing protein [Multifurca ochricompacta]|uniref:SNF2 family N-terminal domain-containing protein n=1 Tax=Multifurca ochricompacta TaxID=376703 RepID=A0AAD4QLS7_9AGAM|nr:SNF2 family N-terminal domain-containing protein [Multifurca ochricompacta]
MEGAFVHIGHQTTIIMTASSVSPSPGPSFAMTPAQTSSTAASTPPAVDSDPDDARFMNMQALLEKSSIYTEILKDQMDRSREKHASVAATTQKRTPKQKQRQSFGRAGRRHASGRGKRMRMGTDDEGDGEEPSKRAKVLSDEHKPAFVQPALLTGAKLKDYQLEGVAWMVSLWENGISGILADEMGLGKTIQTIAFVAYLRVRIEAPFLVVCPLSVLHNWKDEFERYVQISVCMYHGTPEERAELRNTVMASHYEHADLPKRKSERMKTRRASWHRDLDSDEDSDIDTVTAGDDDLNPTIQKSSFPVVITTYEMIIKDRAHLAKYDWGQVIVDEGHRLKNMDSILMREIKKYPSAGRMLLTGTPLHNNLAELWSLLNFILPEVFDDVAAFQESFKIPNLSDDLAESRNTVLIHKLHEILRPFLLRRLKADVERTLPPKKEYVLYAPLSERQREVYDAVVKGSLRGLLAGVRTGKDAKESERQRIVREIEEDEKAGRVGTRTRKSRASIAPTTQSVAEIGAEYAFKAKLKKVNNMHLQNVVMQLRKVCSHPFLFDWPVDPRTHHPVVDEQLVDASGKMMVLERLLDALFARGHKVLVFSQFVTMLNVIEVVYRLSLATVSNRWFDGPLERRAEMGRFQEGGNKPDAPCLFLLSTRAGGLGINLTAADTVVFYDQDWTKPVLIFRLVSRHTIESKIMQRASEKRQLEALVIAKGKFKAPIGGNAKAGEARQTIAEMAAQLLELEGEHIEVVPSTAAGKRSVISDAELDMLLDRRKEVFEGRGLGWKSGQSGKKGDYKDRRATSTPGLRNADGGLFEVYEAPQDEGNDALAHMLGEDVTV